MINRFTGCYRFLSNFYPALIRYQGWIWPSAEHAYQAMKTFDQDQRKEILHADTPSIAKRIGRHVTMRYNWDKVKLDIMRDIVRAKFEQNPDLMLDLLGTGDEELIEGNHWGDTFWGQCNGVGENWLGKILMEIRDGQPG